MSKKIVILGVTGNIGSKLAKQLLGKGHQIIGVGRKAEKVSQLGLVGIDFRQGEVSDVPFLTALLSEADAAFTMIPPNSTAPDVLAFQDQTGEAIVQAVKASGIRYVVNLSSQGADLEAGTGPIVGVHRQEIRLNQLDGINVLHLRPTYFMENLLNAIPMITHMGINGSALQPDLALPMIATKDIAFATAEVLDQLNFQGKGVKDLLGPKEITMQEVTRLIGQTIGKPDLPYVQFTYEDAEKGMQQAGLSPSMAALYVEMLRNANEKGTFTRTQRTPRNTTPTTLEEFINEVKGAFAAVSTAS